MNEGTGNQAAQPDNTHKTAKSAVLKAIMHHPLAGWIVGIAVSLYFYRIGIRERDLTYYISPARTAITQLGSNNLFTIQIGGHAIGGDLSAMQIQIWNAGRQPISRDDILQPVTLTSEHNVPLFTTAIALKRAPDINGFNSYQTNYLRVGDALISTNQQGQTNGMSQFLVGTKLVMNWNILEKGKDSFKINVIYGGNVNEKFSIEGVIAGQNAISKYEDEASYYKRIGKPTNYFFVLAVIGFVISLFRNTALEKNNQVRYRLLNKVVRYWFLTLFIGYAWVVLLPLYHVFIADKPPFGF